MNIMILGASGMIGQYIVAEGVSRGHQIAALTRNPSRFPNNVPHVQVIQADILDSTNLASVFTGAEVVVNATGDRSGEARTFFLTSTRAVIDAARKAHVPRLIVVGGAGSLEVAPGVQGVDTEDFPATYRHIALAQRETLEFLRASDISWTFFSPPSIIKLGQRTGQYRLGTNELLFNEAGNSYISAQDYAIALLSEIEKPRFIRQRFTAVSLKD